MKNLKNTSAFMLNKLKLANVGPSKEIEIDFKKRINVITGDNGLGKTFMLDAIWWSLTRIWPKDINPKVGSGNMIRPTCISKPAEITASFQTRSRKGGKTFTRTFNRKTQSWSVEQARPPIPGIVIYAQVDGSFSIWDPVRNYSQLEIFKDIEIRPPEAYVFTPNELWNGLNHSDGSSHICNGIYQDVARWLSDKDTKNIDLLQKILTKLSPPNEEIKLKGTQRIAINDTRDYPTIETSYKTEVPIIYASSAVKRIFALAYAMLWNWNEHATISKLIGRKCENNIIVIFDEVECHLHPKWQRTIISSIIEMIKLINNKANIQLIMTTHSPIIMSSLENSFNVDTDTWTDIDLDKNTGKVEVVTREFKKQGTADLWLQSEAFNLPSAYSIASENAITQAKKVLSKGNINSQELQDAYDALIKVLPVTDPFLFRFRYLCEHRGLKFR